MRVTVRFFALLRDAAEGRDALELDLPSGASVADAVAELEKRFVALRLPLKRSAVAINRAYASRQSVLSDGDELALIPPVSGG